MRPNVVRGRKRTPESEHGSLFVRTRELLRVDPRPLDQIGKESGIPYLWLRDFSRGALSDSSVHRIQKLYEFLKGVELEV